MSLSPVRGSYLHQNSMLFLDQDKEARIVDVALNQINGGADVINYFSDGGKFNRDNPHLIRAGRESLIGPSSCEMVLSSPDTERKSRQTNLSDVCMSQGEIFLGDWLRMKLSRTTWENDSETRDVIPRVVLAILHEGNTEKIQIVNEFLQSISPYQTKAKGWFDFKALFHKNDDFTITIFTKVLYQFGNDPTKIHPETRQHLLNSLLTYEGTSFDDTIPHTFFFGAITSLIGYDADFLGIRNTENHILMINGSAYLKNQYMRDVLGNQEEKYNNHNSELEIQLCGYLDDLFEKGLIEFNSIPYSGYTIDALLNLYDFANEPVKSKAAKVLDLICTSYAVHSTPNGQSFRPFARQHLKVANKDFIKDYSLRAFMMPWINNDTSFYMKEGNTKNSIFSLSALTTSYRPLQITADLLNTNEGYLALTNHRFNCTEISYKGTSVYNNQEVHYLISGGGNRENLTLDPFKMYGALEQQAREVVARPITLIIEDENTNLENATLANSLFIGTPLALAGRNDGKDTTAGPGVDARGRNNSGTYHNFACGSAPVQIPRNLHPVCERGGWRLYEPKNGFTVAVYSEDNLGMFALFPSTKPSFELLDAIYKNNQVPLSSFTFPLGFANIMEGSTVHFDVNSPMDKWVITGFTTENNITTYFSDQARILGNASTRAVVQASQTEKAEAPLGNYQAINQRTSNQSIAQKIYHVLNNIFDTAADWIIFQFRRFVQIN